MVCETPAELHFSGTNKGGISHPLLNLKKGLTDDWASRCKLHVAWRPLVATSLGSLSGAPEFQQSNLPSLKTISGSFKRLKRGKLAVDHEGRKYLIDCRARGMSANYPAGPKEK